jgi:hypothetical protein
MIRLKLRGGIVSYGISRTSCCAGPCPPAALPAIDVPECGCFSRFRLRSFGPAGPSCPSTAPRRGCSSPLADLAWSVDRRAASKELTQTATPTLGAKIERKILDSFEIVEISATPTAHRPSPCPLGRHRRTFTDVLGSNARLRAHCALWVPTSTHSFTVTSVQ